MSERHGAMGLLDYVRVLRRRWTWVVAPALTIVAAFVFWALSSPASYSSTETLFYTGAAQDGATDTRLNSYASLATSARLVDAIRAELGLAQSTTDVAGKITAKAEPNTLIVTVTAKETTAEGARRLAAAAARQLVVLSTSLEATTGGRLPQPSLSGPQPSSSGSGPSAGQSQPSSSPIATDQTPGTGVSGDQVTGRLVAADSATVAVEENTPVRIIGLGALFGVLAGIVLALVREATDTRVRSPEQLHHLGIPEQRVVRVEDCTEDLPLGQVAEGYRVLRTVLFRGGHTQPTSIVVSSCDPEHYSPGVAAALAVTFARAATRVVLVSTNLRPTPSGPEWATAEPGLGNVLAAQSPLADAVEPTQQTDLWLMPAGRSLPYPEDSLASIAMSEIVGELRSEFDLVIMDALPLTAYADGLSTAEATGAGVLLTVLQGRTRRQQVRGALDTLASLGAPVVAVALVRPLQRTMVRGPAHARSESGAAAATPSAATPSAATPSAATPSAPDQSALDQPEAAPPSADSPSPVTGATVEPQPLVVDEPEEVSAEAREAVPGGEPERVPAGEPEETRAPL